MTNKRHYSDYTNLLKFYRLGFTDGRYNFPSETNEIIEQLHEKIDREILLMYLDQYITGYCIGKSMNRECQKVLKKD